jgi:hypothetical protein
LFALCSLLFLVVPSKVMGQFWGGCVDAAGRPVTDYPSYNINDIAVSSLAPNGASIIQYNPRVVVSVGPVTRRFFYLHECGHHALGQVLTGNYIPFECNGRPIADIVPVKTVVPVWKKPPLIHLSLGSLSLGDEVLADRGDCTAVEPRGPGE